MIKQCFKSADFISAFTESGRLVRVCAYALGVCLLAAIQAAAQGRGGAGGFGGGGFGGGGGGFGGGGIGGGGIGGGGARGAASTSRTYYNNGTVGEAMISVDPETRRLIVITDDETGQYVSQVITNLDRPQPQVLIKVVFLEVTHNKGLDIGVEGAYRSDYFGNSATGTFANIFGLTGLNQAAGGTNSGLLNPFGQNLGNFQSSVPGGLYQIAGSDYQATLHAIATAGKTEVLSRPSILARNNQPATITVGQSVPLITSTTYSALNNLPISSYSYTSVGIILRVTPFINSDNMVEMIVSPQISQLEDKSQWVQTAPGISAPVIDTRSADTVVVTPDGQTVIIGGLMQKTKQHAETKIPFVGDIPWLGNLFKRRIQSDSKTELIIFLTPHIVMAPSQLAGLTARERGTQELPQKAFTEKELNQFIDNLPAPIPPANQEKMTPEMEKKAREMLR